MAYNCALSAVRNLPRERHVPPSIKRPPNLSNPRHYTVRQIGREFIPYSLSLSLDIPNLIFYRRAKLSSLPLRSLFFIVTSIVINNRTTMIRTGRSRRNVGNKTRIFPRKQFLTILRSTFLRRFFFSLIASGLKFKFDSLQESSFFIVHFRFISIYKSVRAGI